MKRSKGLRPRTYNTSDRALRFRVFRYMADPQLEGKILVENMEAVFQWLKAGKAAETLKPGAPKLAVNNDKKRT